MLISGSCCAEYERLFRRRLPLSFWATGSSIQSTCSDIGLRRSLDEIGFNYVCRTDRSTLVEDHGGETFPIRQLHPFSGQRYALVEGASVTGQCCGPVQVIFWHEEGYENGVPLVTNFELAEEAIRFYKRRFQIETLFSDQKSRGFHVHIPPA